MKSIIILGDGMADEPIEALGGKTPMQYADTPYMDKLAALGVTGQMKTVGRRVPSGQRSCQHGRIRIRPAESIRMTWRTGSCKHRCHPSTG